jgi:hypothetical protein
MKPLAALLAALTFGRARRFCRDVSAPQPESELVLIHLAVALPIYGPPLLRSAQDLPVWVLAVGGAWTGLALLRVLARPLTGHDFRSKDSGDRRMSL